MDGIIIVTAVILAVIALIEIITFFSVSPKKTPSYFTVLPVFADDKYFQQRLEYILQKSCGRTNIIIVDYSADNNQTELCRQFVDDNPDVVFISHEELQKYFAETFAISTEI